MKFISSTKTPIQTGRKLLRPKSPLRRLEWKLTGLFVLASTFTAALVHLILFGAIMLALFSKNVLPNELVEALKSHEAQARSYFAGDKPDIQGLTRLLDQAILNTGTEAEGFQFVSYAASTGVMTAAIGDGSGNILVASPVKSPFPIGRPLESALLPGEVAYLNEARNGKVVAGWVNGRLVAAGRITRHQKVVGLAFLRSGVMLNGWKTWGPITADFFATLIFTALVTLPVGALVGKVFAKRITNRLSGISVTADRWAKGDLSVTASEQPQDEIGLLASKLNQMAGELRDLISFRKTLATIEERQRITRDLHDTVKQEAFATAMMVSSAQQYLEQKDYQNLKISLDEAFELSRKMQTDLSTILMQLRADGVQLSIGDQLEEIGRAWEKRTEINIRVKVAEGLAFAPGVTEHVVRIAEEALANAVKHSKGQTVSLKLARVDDRLRLSVTDDGIGMNADETSKGMGLQSMRERAALLPSGVLRISPNSFGGTQVRVDFREE